MITRGEAVAAIVLLAARAAVAGPAKLDTARIEEVTGLKGTWIGEEGVFKVQSPRADAKVVVDGWTMPPFMGHLAGARLVVVDPRRTPTAERAIASGGLHLAPVPGTDLVLALGMLHAAVVAGHLDTAYLDARTSGFDDANTSRLKYTG